MCAIYVDSGPPPSRPDFHSFYSLCSMSKYTSRYPPVLRVTYGCIHLIGSHFQYYFYITHLVLVVNVTHALYLHVTLPAI